MDNGGIRPDSLSELSAACGAWFYDEDNFRSERDPHTADLFVRLAFDGGRFIQLDDLVGTDRRIERVKELAFQLGTSNERLSLKERCSEALALSESAAEDWKMSRKRAELQGTLTSVERLIKATFLDD